MADLRERLPEALRLAAARREAGRLRAVTLRLGEESVGELDLIADLCEASRAEAARAALRLGLDALHHQITAAPTVHAAATEAALEAGLDPSPHGDDSRGGAIPSSSPANPISNFLPT